MYKRVTQALVGCSILLLAACSGQSGSSLPGTGSGSALYTSSNSISSCDAAGPGFATCFALVRTDIAGGVLCNGGNQGAHIMSTTPAGYGPSALQSAYSLPSATAGSGQTIAIVDAYDDPNAENDVNVYRSQYGIPACTTSGGCFKKVNQSGVQGSYPKASGSWAQEISLDLDMVSAVCPNCHILLVEGTSNSNANLAAAVDTAARLGANAISNSYGSAESSTSVSYDSHYQHAGVAITASSGDSGYGTQSPASALGVTAVGGTHLTQSGSTWSESAWSSAGSGCSGYNAEPSWQTTYGITVCGSHRGEADVSAVADPNTGVAVYDSYTYRGQGGWMVFGGTSVASPIIASVYGLAGNAGTIMAAPTGSSASYAYTHTSSLHDVKSGSNGSCGTIVCNAGTGWDGPTGLGTPNGTGAF